MHAKYLILRIDDQEVPVIFPDRPCALSHRHFAAAFPGEIVSGGYCCTETWAAFGEVVSVNLKSRGSADSLLLLKHFSGEEPESKHG